MIISKNANVTYHKGSKDGANCKLSLHLIIRKKKTETSASINVNENNLLMVQQIKRLALN